MKIPVALALAGCLVTAACNPRPAAAPAGSRSAAPSPTPSGLPPLRIIGKGTAGQPVRIVEQQGNRKIYELVSDSYESTSARSVAQATFRNARVTFYDKDGSTMSARAPIARIDERRKKVILSGGVHATTSTGQTLRCERLVYDRQTGMLHGSGHVRVTGRQNGMLTVLTGNEFDSNLNLTQMRMQ